MGLLTGSIADWPRSRPRPATSRVKSAVIIGIASSVVCYIAVDIKNKMNWDDALDVWGVHGVGGFIGIVMLGMFANKLFNPAEHVDGLFSGPPEGAKFL